MTNRTVTVLLVLCWGSSLVLCARNPPKNRDQRDATAPSASDVQQLIKQMGARGALSDLYRQKATWNTVLKNMAAGSRDWLRILVVFSNVADAGSAHEIGIVASQAIGSAPELALEMLGPEFGLYMLCQNPDSVHYDIETATRMIEERRRALSTVRNPKLVGMRDQCIAMLNELEEELRAARRETSE